MEVSRRWADEVTGRMREGKKPDSGQVFNIPGSQFCMPIKLTSDWESFNGGHKAKMVKPSSFDSQNIIYEFDTELTNYDVYWFATGDPPGAIGDILYAYKRLVWEVLSGGLPYGIISAYTHEDIPAYSAVRYGLRNFITNAVQTELLEEFDEAYFDKGNVVPPESEEMLDLYRECQEPFVNAPSTWLASLLRGPGADSSLLYLSMPIGIAQTDIKAGTFGPVMIHGMSTVLIDNPNDEKIDTTIPLCGSPKSGVLTKCPLPYGNIFTWSSEGFYHGSQPWTSYNKKYDDDENYVADYFWSRVEPWITVPRTLRGTVNTSADGADYFGNYSSGKYSCVDVSYRDVDYKFKVPLDVGQIKKEDFDINKEYYLSFFENIKGSPGNVRYAYNYMLDKPIAYYPHTFIGRVVEMTSPISVFPQGAVSGSVVKAVNATNSIISVDEYVIVIKTENNRNDRLYYIVGKVS